LISGGVPELGLLIIVFPMTKKIMGADYEYNVSMGEFVYHCELKKEVNSFCIKAYSDLE